MLTNYTVFIVCKMSIFQMALLPKNLNFTLITMVRMICRKVDKYQTLQ